jgi:hypothetical protein
MNGLHMVLYNNKYKDIDTAESINKNNNEILEYMLMKTSSMKQNNKIRIYQICLSQKQYSISFQETAVHVLYVLYMQMTRMLFHMVH